MTSDKLTSEAISYQWDFYERTVSNYSVIIRLLHCLEKENNLITHGPEILVAEMPFEVCRVSVNKGDAVKYGFFSIENSDDNLDSDIINAMCAGVMSPSLLSNVFGYGILYVYPLKDKMDIIGYLILGKRLHMTVDEPFLRELSMICDVFNKLLYLPQKTLSPVESKTHAMLYEKMLDEFPDPMFLLDINGSICYANKMAEDEFNSGKNYLVGEKFNNIFNGLDKDLVATGKSIDGKVEYLKGHEYKVFNIRCYPLKGEHPEDGHMKCVVLRDILEEKIENQQKLQKSKAESFSLLASGMAHDFNNLLTGILGYASLMKNFLEQDDKLLKYTTAIENSAQRAAKLTRHLLSFSRRQSRQIGIIDVNAILNDLIFLVEARYKDITVSKHLYEGFPPTRGDEVEMQNALLNLFINAIDAMNGAGQLSVTTEHRHSQDGRGFAVIEIRDSGPGINEELKKRIFEPYFSTKTKDNNVGMGLYLVRKTISNHGGIIEVDSEEGKGTAFIVYLPLDISRKENKVSEESVTNNRIKAESRILVVDDEDVIREFLKGVLTVAGAQVIEARNGIEAINIFKESYHALDLVILDMIMPGIKGNEVLKELRKISKDIKIIIASGFMSERQRQSLKEHNVDAFLDKPFRDKDLIQAICASGLSA